MADSDSVEYFLFLVDQLSPSLKKLRQINDELVSFAISKTNNYIWHKDEFRIQTVVPCDNDDFVPHLHGVVYHDGNVADEWFIVYILMAFSRERRDIIIRIFDDDGEFFLLEAADELPKWIESKEINYQTYIYDGAVRILPGMFSARKNAVRYIIDRLYDVNNCEDVEATVTRRIKQRIDNYANNMDSFFHKTRLYIPSKVAAILDAKPSLISKAVTAYRHFKSDSTLTNLRQSKKIHHILPVDMTVRLVKFSKYLYAMISCTSKEIPENHLGWRFPPSSAPNFKEHELGYKITCGFEVLASMSDRKWIRYVEILKKKDYFKGLLEGSKEYVELERKAKSFFLTNVTMDDEDKELLAILLNTSYDYEKFKREESDLPASDDDKWMEVSEEDIEKLTDPYNVKKGCSANGPHQLVSKLADFLNRYSDMEGVEMENDEKTDTTMDIKIGDIGENPIKFNVDEFLPAMNKMLNVLDSGTKSESDDDESDFYSDDFESDADDGDKDPEIQSLMDTMDEELQSSSLSPNLFTKSSQKNSKKSMNNDADVLKNIMNSISEECGRIGPAGNLLYSANLTLDKCRKKET